MRKNDIRQKDLEQPSHVEKKLHDEIVYYRIYRITFSYREETHTGRLIEWTIVELPSHIEKKQQFTESLKIFIGITFSYKEETNTLGMLL